MGLAAFDGYNWRYKNFDANYNLNLAEMTVLTLSSGDTIKIEQKVAQPFNARYYK